LVTTEILTLVLSMRGEVVTRDTIFTHIIEPHGSASTNNNLNQYIMNLRKQLLFLGLETSIIETVPRIGFMMPAGIEVVTVQPEEKPKPAPAPVRQTLNVETKVWATKIWLALMIGTTLSALAYAWYSDEKDADWGSFPTPYAQPLNNDPNCRVYLIPSGMTVFTGTVPDYRATIDEAGKMKCEPGVKTRYYLSHSSVDEARYRSFVLRCTDNPGTGPTCYSSYLVREK
jgi:DNA-binding winged-HTH domains